MSLDDIRSELTPERADDLKYVFPRTPSEWAALTDDELFVLRRKVEQRQLLTVEFVLGNELTTRLIRALSELRRSNDTASKRLERLTWALVGFTIVIAAFTVALFFHG